MKQKARHHKTISGFRTNKEHTRTKKGREICKKADKLRKTTITRKSNDNEDEKQISRKIITQSKPH